MARPLEEEQTIIISISDISETSEDPASPEAHLYAAIIGFEARSQNLSTAHHEITMRSLQASLSLEDQSTKERLERDGSKAAIGANEVRRLLERLKLF